MTTENPWVRLHRIAEARMDHIGMTQTGLKAAGGGTGAWLRSLKNNVEPPSRRRRDPLDALDRALRWTEGTSWRLLTEDRSGWTAESLECEEVELIEHDDEAGFFGTLVAAKMRQLSPEEFVGARAEIAAILHMPELPSLS